MTAICRSIIWLSGTWNLPTGALVLAMWTSCISPPIPWTCGVLKIGAASNMPILEELPGLPFVDCGDKGREGCWEVEGRELPWTVLPPWDEPCTNTTEISKTDRSPGSSLYLWRLIAIVLYCSPGLFPRPVLVLPVWRVLESLWGQPIHLKHAAYIKVTCASGRPSDRSVELLLLIGGLQ